LPWRGSLLRQLGMKMPGPQSSEIETEITAFVRAHFPQFSSDETGVATELLSRGLDSLAVLDLMTFLSERFGLELQEEDFAAENFETVGTLCSLVERRLT
jgi:acyl carrier protein